VGALVALVGGALTTRRPGRASEGHCDDGGEYY